MWDVLVAAAQAPALQWTVVVAALAAFVWKIITSKEGVLMGDLFPDEGEEQV